ncbi:MAG: hypothetical protein H9W80_13420 [Enterococcus sp.]|nr:hypothetical protein [Enterococcus sp.]
MSKTVREIAELMGAEPDDLVKAKQRIRDEIKRQGIKTSKQSNRFVIEDSDVEKIVGVLQPRINEESSKTDEKTEELLQKIRELEEQNKRLKQENKDKDEEMLRMNSKKDEEIRRLNGKIEKYADDFKDLNDKQLQLNNQQQQLQARILEQTKQLKDSQQKLLDSSEKSSQLQDKVDKIENASLWQRITRKFD